MDLIGWSLNAIDQIFSTRKQGQGEPACPDGTFAAGYMMDSWKEWRPLCLAILSVEDVEDVYIIGMMITGFLLFGGCGFLFYRKVSMVMAAYSAFEKLPAIVGLQSWLCSRHQHQTGETLLSPLEMESLSSHTHAHKTDYTHTPWTHRLLDSLPPPLPSLQHSMP